MMVATAKSQARLHRSAVWSETFLFEFELSTFSMLQLVSILFMVYLNDFAFRKSLEPEQFYSRGTDGHTTEHTDTTALETACSVSNNGKL